MLSVYYLKYLQVNDMQVDNRGEAVVLVYTYAFQSSHQPPTILKSIIRLFQILTGLDRRNAVRERVPD
jgi:hypothetical protein